uniref:Uncharacterized protein n=1 Tax=Tetranychus urticae TaxID=32264 RepID=T1KHC1_TETUR
MLLIISLCHHYFGPPTELCFEVFKVCLQIGLHLNVTFPAICVWITPGMDIAKQLKC